MKKVVLVVACLFLLTSWAQAQVVANFESDLNGWTNNAWGAMVGGPNRVADPTGKSSFVMQVPIDCSLSDHGSVEGASLNLDKKPQLVTIWVWLPAGTPDDLNIQIWGQNRTNWAWTSVDNKAKDIPKETWFPIEYPARKIALTNADASVIYDGSTAMRFGLQIIRDAANTTWTGNILFDNETFIGVNPTVLADFQAGNTFKDAGWGGAALAGLSTGADPADASNTVLKESIDFTKGDRATVVFSNMPGSTNQPYVVYNIWLPANTPDDLEMEIFAQDNSHWSHVEGGFIKASTIPKETWFPLYFPLAAMQAKYPSTFDVKNNGFGWLGFDLNSWNIAGGSTWAGDILIDNVGLLNEVTEPIWVVSDFETPAADVDGFYATATQQTIQAVERVAAPTADQAGNHAIKATVDLSLGQDGVIAKDNCTLYSAAAKKYANKVSLDVFVPADFPSGATVSLALKGLATENLTIYGEGNALVAGQWNTVILTTAPSVEAGLVNPQKTTSILTKIHFNAVQSWQGEILFDNLKFYGIDPIIKTIVSPFAMARVKSSLEDAGAVVPFDYILVEWVDNLKGTETYNIYVSKKPITSTYGKDVVKVATSIPHGQLAWAFRPYTSDGSDQSYYLVVTANDGTRECDITEQCKVGPLTIKTSKTTKVQYVKDFASSFALDGVDGEFQPYVDNISKPEIDGNQRRNWTPGSADFDYRSLFVIDDNYLYMSTVVTDDEPNMAAGLPGWSSAMEFFLGFYDAGALKAWHGARAVTNDQTTGDWRIGITPDAELETGGSNAGMTIDGVEAATRVAEQNNNWTMEVRFDLKKLGKFGAFNLVNGMLLPYRVDGSDNDPSKGDGTNRGVFAQTNGYGSITVDGVQMDYNWERPSTWGFLEVVNFVDVAQGTAEGLPTSFALYNNYPNPFNPTTNIKYDLPKEAKVSLKVYDVLGREVASLVDAKQTAGRYEVNFNAGKYASGVYIYRLIAGDFIQTMKMMLVK